MEKECGALQITPLRQIPMTAGKGNRRETEGDENDHRREQREDLFTASHRKDSLLLHTGEGSVELQRETGKSERRRKGVSTRSCSLSPEVTKTLKPTPVNVLSGRRKFDSNAPSQVQLHQL